MSPKCGAPALPDPSKPAGTSHLADPSDSSLPSNPTESADSTVSAKSAVPNASRDHVRPGRAFESAAARWLSERGYTLLERNYTVRGGEIDLIFDLAGKTVFVEVKARAEGDNLRRFGPPAAAVNPAKQARLIHAAECYLRAHPERHVPRMDVMEITYAYLKPFYCLRFHHIPAAFGKRREEG